MKPGDVSDAVLVVDSRGDLLRIDPAGATNVAPAQPVRTNPPAPDLAFLQATRQFC